MTVWSDEAGDGPLVALVHGSMDRSTAFVNVRKRLLAAGRRVIVLDRRGYARSREVGPPFTIAANVDDLVGLLDDRPAVVVGHSLGGVIAASLADHHRHLVRALCVFEAPMSWEPAWPSTSAGAASIGLDPADAAERFMARMIGKSRWDRLPERTRLERRAEGPALVGELADVRREAPYQFEALTCPVVVGHGDRSPTHLIDASVRLARLVAEGEVHLIEHSGHGAHSSHPSEFAALVERAIARADDVSG